MITIMWPSDCKELSNGRGICLDGVASKSIAAQLGRVPGVDNAPTSASPVEQRFLFSPLSLICLLVMPPPPLSVVFSPFLVPGQTGRRTSAT